MFKHRAIALGALFASFLVGAAVGCVETEVGSTERTSDAGAGVVVGGFEDDGGTDAQSPLCPTTPPKIGESCPRQLEGEARCTYHVDECHAGNGVYPVTVDYCCFMGTWTQCGTNQTPCDLTDGGLSQQPDAAAPVDASDAALDAGADAAVDLAVPADAAADASTPDAGAEPDAVTAPDVGTEVDAAVDGALVDPDASEPGDAALD